MENTIIRANDISQEIKRILVEDMQLNVTPEQIPDDYSLLESGLALDSILISELIARIEDRFGLQLDDRVLRADLFNNLAHLVSFVAQEHLAVQSKVQNSHSGGAKC